MADLIKLCKKYFGKNNLYEIFDIDKNAKEKEIKRAYHRLSLKTHPDRVAEELKVEATEKFKVISAIYSVLSNKSQRALYDKTGSVENDDCLDIENWKQYWQSIFKEVTDQDIINYEKKYKGSKEEHEDLKKAYINNKGDMNKILEYVLFSNPDDETRFGEILNNLIETKEVPAFDKYVKEPASRKEARRKKYEKESKLATKEVKKRKSSEMSCESSEVDLMKAIQSRQVNRAAQQNDFLQKLEEKYSNPKPKMEKRRRKK